MSRNTRKIKIFCDNYSFCFVFESLLSIPTILHVSDKGNKGIFFIVRRLLPTSPSSPGSLQDEGYSTCSQNTPNTPLSPLSQSTFVNQKTKFSPTLCDTKKNKTDSLSKAEIKELNALLTIFDAEKLECSPSSSSCEEDGASEKQTEGNSHEYNSIDATGIVFIF